MRWPFLGTKITDWSRWLLSGAKNAGWMRWLFSGTKTTDWGCRSSPAPRPRTGAKAFLQYHNLPNRLTVDGGFHLPKTVRWMIHLGEAWAVGVAGRHAKEADQSGGSIS